MSPATPTGDTRQQFRETVAQVAEKAKAILPTAVNGRVEAAVKLVLQGDVEPQEDGTIRVGSSDPTRYYVLTGQACTCTDFTQGKAPQGWCKHRVAAGIAKRVNEMLAALPAPAPEPTPVALPEAPCSINFKGMLHGYEMQFTIRDADESRLLARLQTLLKTPGLRPVPKPAPRHSQWRKGGTP